MLRIHRGRAGGRQSGYMLLVLMLAVAMLAITLLGVATNYRQSIRRDREVEMVHRGVQYERAVRLYYRKNKSYPPSIDRLLETNSIRYLRKPYKDPMTPDGVWKIAHLTDVKLPTSNTGLGTTPTSTSTTPNLQSGTTGGSSSGSDSGAQSPGNASGSSTTGGTSEGTAVGTTTGTTNGTTTGASSGTASGTASGAATTQTGAGAGDQSSTPTGNSGPANTSGGTGEVLGGGAMIGVVSKSSQEGVHSFNEKTKYNEWLFIYLPTQDVTNQPGRIPNGPFNPKATIAGSAVGQSGLTPNPATPGTMTPNPIAPTPTMPQSPTNQ